MIKQIPFEFYSLGEKIKVVTGNLDSEQRCFVMAIEIEDARHCRQKIVGMESYELR